MKGEDALDQEMVPYDDATTEGTDPLAPEEPEAVTYAGGTETDPDDDAPWFVDWLSEKTVGHYGCDEIPHESNVGHPAFRRRGSAGETIRAASQAQAAIAALIAQRPDDAAFAKAVTAAVEGVGLWTLSLKADVDAAAWIDLQREAERRHTQKVRKQVEKAADKRREKGDPKREMALEIKRSNPALSAWKIRQEVANAFRNDGGCDKSVLKPIAHQLNAMPANDDGLTAA